MSRKEFTFIEKNFDGCYSHMLYCMAFTYSELENLNTEVSRVLNKDSLNIYTVRNHSDADYKKGTHRGQDLYEMNGYIVHYFSDEKIQSNILLVDTIGDLKRLYSYCKIAYIGGGMGNTGLHNILEACVFDIPVVIGKNYKKFLESIDLVF